MVRIKRVALERPGALYSALQGMECRDKPGAEHRTGIKRLHPCCAGANHWRHPPLSQAWHDAAEALHHRHSEMGDGHEGSAQSVRSLAKT
jgi:hypothetical protein